MDNMNFITLLESVRLSNFIVILDNYTNGYNINFLNILSILCIIFSILTIISKNPVLSILFLISLFLSVSVYLIMIGITFIGIAYLLVYIGAVSMLFLFILMLIDIRISELHVQNNNSLFLAFLIGILFYISNFNVNNIFNKYINKYTYINNYNS
jgi:NADH-ubiquinone oxidoreductase chain 6